MRFLQLGGALLVLLQAWEVRGPQVHYSLFLGQRTQHRVQVRMQVSGLERQNLVVAMPAWNNLYQIRDFVRKMGPLRASDGQGRSLPLKRLDKQSWELLHPGGDLNLDYWVVLDENNSFSSHLDEEHLFLHPALACLYLPRYRQVPHSLSLHDYPSSWRVISGMPLQEGAFQAGDYDHLIDSPLEAGHFELQEFELGGGLYQVVVHGRGEAFPWPPFLEMIRRLVQEASRLMGGVPSDRYLFIYHLSEGGSGGMEHRNSTAIGLDRGAVSRDPLAAAGVTAHEFFHLWNVKRIRPAAFHPMDWSREVYTSDLWFSEGGTSYYADLLLLRSGLWDEERALRSLARRIQRLEARPARLHQSLEEASWETWLERYADYDRPDRSISYYNKGALVCFFLDLLIRYRTQSRRSLDDVVRSLDKWYGRGEGLQPGDLQRAVETVAGSDFSEFFARYVAGTEEIPYGEFLSLAGLKRETLEVQEVDYGFQLASPLGSQPRVVEVRDKSPAERAGLRSGDVLLRINDESSGDLPLLAWRPALELRVLVQREGQERLIRFRPEYRRVRRTVIRRDPGAPPAQRELLEAWLRGKP